MNFLWNVLQFLGLFLAVLTILLVILVIFYFIFALVNASAEEFNKRKKSKEE